MPFEMLGPDAGPPETMPMPAPPKLGVIQTTEALMGDYRVPTIWAAIMERDPEEARQKLLSVIEKDIGAAPPPGFDVPCIVKEEEGKNHVERSGIRRAQRRMADNYAHLVDKLVRYRPESRGYAFESWDVDLDMRKSLWKPYECEAFRGAAPAKEAKAKAAKKKKDLRKEAKTEAMGRLEDIEKGA